MGRDLAPSQIGHLTPKISPVRSHAAQGRSISSWITPVPPQRLHKFIAEDDSSSLSRRLRSRRPGEPIAEVVYEDGGCLLDGSGGGNITAGNIVASDTQSMLSPFRVAMAASSCNSHCGDHGGDGGTVMPIVDLPF
jgi:hypothetical protein